MLNMLPVQNCFHFLSPMPLDMWKGYDVPGIVGVLKRDANGQYVVIDAFECERVPNVNQLIADERFGDWINVAESSEALRFDVFLMPQASIDRRTEVVMLLERSCGFRTTQAPAYAHAV